MCGRYIALQSLQFFFIIVLRAESVTIFEPKVLVTENLVQEQYFAPLLCSSSACQSNLF